MFVVFLLKIILYTEYNMSIQQSFWKTTNHLYIHYGRVDIRLGNGTIQALFTTLPNRGKFVLQQVWGHFDGGDPGTTVGWIAQISRSSSSFVDPDRLCYMSNPITPTIKYTAFTDIFTYPDVMPQVNPDTICYIRNSAASNVNSTSHLVTFIIKGYYEREV